MKTLDALTLRQPASPQITGPPYDYEHTDALLKDLSQKWGKASVLMHQLCSQQGAQYFHFLQPNQYLAGSKVMGNEERSLADIHYMDPGRMTRLHREAEGISLGYEGFRKEGKRLAGTEGLPFTDLTFLFEQENRIVYRDPCCHFNELGLDLMYQEIARHLIKSYSP